MSETDEELYQRLDAERPCPRCAALEAEVRRLEANIVNVSRAWNEAVSERDAKAALLGELAAAARDYRWNPSSNPAVLQAAADRLDEVLRRTEAEAGGEKQG